MKNGYLKQILAAEYSEANKLIKDGLQETTEKILGSINPITIDSIPFIISSMEKILGNIKEFHPEACEVAKNFMIAFKTENTEILFVDKRRK